MDFAEQIENIGHWIATKRCAQAISQSQLSSKAGISQQQLSKIETGGNCTIITLLKILTALGENLELPVTTSESIGKIISDSNEGLTFI